MFVSVFDPLPSDRATASYLGGKGYGLWWMTQNGINVPPALIIPTSACVLYMKDPKAAMSLVAEALPKVTEFFISRFGYMPLLSVRSGARVSMPGMMDTILNVGLDQSSEPFWREKLGDDCAADCLQRLITMYGTVVKGIERASLECEDIASSLLQYKNLTGEAFPAAEAQLLASIEAVFKSWNNPRAVTYRRMYGYDDAWGTAVILQAMVFGNANGASGTGVIFSRNCSTGEDVVTGEWLEQAQGEDVVAGIRTPLPLDAMARWNATIYAEVLAAAKKLEAAKRDVQDIEVTIQDGVLYVLQTRTAKRTPYAAVRIAVDMFQQGLIDQSTALQRVSAAEFSKARVPMLDPAFKAEPVATGLGACLGVATGVAVDRNGAADCTVPFILVGQETDPDDIKWMAKSVGVLTMTGGSTSHAAVVARGMNKPCVVGLGGNAAQWVGKTLSIDGLTGRVWEGAVPVLGTEDGAVEEFETMLWAAANALPVDAAGPVTVIDVADDLALGCVPAAVAKVKAGLAKAKDVIVRLTANRDKVEQEFVAMLGRASDVDAQAALVKALAADLPAADAARVTLLGGSIKTSKFSTAAQVDTLTELIEADGVVFFNGQADGKLTAKVLAMKAAIGEKVVVTSGDAGTRLISLTGLAATVLG